MRPHSRSTRVAFRSAVGASVAIHVVVAVALFVLLRSEEHKPREAAISTRVSADPDVRMRFTEDAAGVEVSPQPVPPTPPTPTPPSTTPEITPTKPAPTAPQPPEALTGTSADQALSAGPFKPAVPNALPPELVALIHKPGAITTSRPAPPSAIHDPNVKPASGISGAKPNAPSARAIHGALGPTQTVVYVLDTSGSMGAAGKFDAARAALVATLKQQPATVRFQVVVYDSSAYPLLASNGTALAATDANIRAATTALAALNSRGKSNHLVAVRTALDFGPDIIVLLTDADDLTARTLKPVLSSVPKPPLVCVGLVTAEGVQQPRELK